MLECTKISQSGLYMTYMWSIKVVNSAAFSIAYNLEQVKKECKYWRKKYPHCRIRVRRIIVVDGIDEQIRKKDKYGKEG